MTSLAPRPRDSQRKRCYDAEDLIRVDLLGRVVGTVGELQEWVDKALAAEPDAPAVTVGTGSGSRRARATWSPARGHRLQVPRHQRSEMVLCHELAHALVAHRYGLGGAAAHGWQWASTYLDLAFRHVSPVAGVKLEAAFVRFGVRYRPPASA